MLYLTLLTDFLTNYKRGIKHDDNDISPALLQSQIYELDKYNTNRITSAGFILVLASILGRILLESHWLINLFLDTLF